MLDRYLLRYFLAVVDQGSFSRAATACNVAQPTLSIGIAKLERIVGQALFLRSNQRVELTQAGSRFLPHARRIERDFNMALQEASGADTQPALRLGVLASVPGVLVAASVAQARPDPAAPFELIFGTERELAGHLNKGRIDMALTRVGRSGGRFAERAVMEEGYALAMPQDHALAGEQEIAAERIARDVMIVRRHCEALSETSRFFTERGVRPHFAMRSTNDERVLAMVAAGLGITVMPDCYTQAGVVRPRLAGFTVRRTLGWVAAQGAEGLLQSPPPIVAALDTHLRAAAKARG